LHNLQNQQL